MINKAPTGIKGLDELAHGGLPRGRTTLVAGEAGAGKTLLALQTLVNGARHHDEPGIFVAFEEDSRRIVANAATFGWDLPELEKKGLFFLDAQPDINLVTSGDFDLGGLLAALEGKVKQMGARRIVFDALDIVMALYDSHREMRREIYRLHDWLLANEQTAILTAKAGEGVGTMLPNLGFVEFMVDCSLSLHRDTVGGMAHRWLRIRKFRGSGFEENDAPATIGPKGLEVASFTADPAEADHFTSERISTGIKRLDSMLAGGYFRGSSALVTGSPGTAKTTLCGMFARACCERGERTLFVSFDSEAAEIVRNLKSVNLDLQPHVDAGTLKLISARALRSNAEIQLMQIREIAEVHQAVNVVVDPASALSKGGNEEFASSIMERLAVWARHAGITLLVSSLLEKHAPEVEGTDLQISTIADTWIHLSYLVHAGERNRGLTIVKSRGTGHSNQVRELLLSDNGVSIEDVYTAGGEVLMGTKRRVREREDSLERTRRREGLVDRQAALDERMQALKEQHRSLERELQTLSAERERYERMLEREEKDSEDLEREIYSMRSGDNKAD